MLSGFQKGKRTMIMFEKAFPRTGFLEMKAIHPATNALTENSLNRREPSFLPGMYCNHFRPGRSETVSSATFYDETIYQ